MKTKKLFAILLAVVLTFSLGVSALADTVTEGTITINNVAVGTELELYQIISYTYETDGDKAGARKAEFVNPLYKIAFKYVIENNSSALPAFVGDITEEDTHLLLYITNNIAYFQQTAIAKQLADALAVYAANDDGTLAPVIPHSYTDVATSGTIVFTPVEMGYYLILDVTDLTGYSAHNQDPILVMMTPDAEINLKSDWTPGVEKEASDLNLNVGDIITYTVKVDIPKLKTDATTNVVETWDFFTITDVLGTGLAFATDLNFTMKVNDYIIPAAYYTQGTVDNTLTIAANLSDDAFKNEIAAFLTNNAGKAIVITYDVVLTVEALGADGFVNDVQVHTPSYDYDTDTTVYTYGFEIKKIDGDTELALAGAKFSVYTEVDNDNLPVGDALKFDFAPNDSDYDYIYNPTGTETELVTGTDGLLTVWGLDLGTYYLFETDAPDGYNLLTTFAEIKIADAVVDDEGNIISEATFGTDKIVYLNEAIENFTGIIIPGTGGIGTTLFTILGSVTVLSAGLFLTLNKKRVFGK